ncbi:MAG: response regulator transcription factor [Anaerolineales bacterium]|nr:response regulator transcription factor [Anaerolineales bacterium]
MSAIRVLIVDDHPVVRGGIRNMIESEGGTSIEVIGEAGSGHEALEMVASLLPDVVLLDMEMPDMSGVEVARRLKDARTGVRILVLSAYNDPQYIRSLLNHGAAGYLIKDEAPEFIVEAIQGVYRGQEGWLSRTVAAQMTVWARGDQEDFGLTPREMQVLRGVVEAKTNLEIGLDLGISDKTVEKHLESVYNKMGVSSRVEAAVMSVRQGLFA